MCSSALTIDTYSKKRLLDWKVPHQRHFQGHLHAFKAITRLGDATLRTVLPLLGLAVAGLLLARAGATPATDKPIRTVVVRVSIFFMVVSFTSLERPPLPMFTPYALLRRKDVR
jgi:hypothetical protein